MFTHFLAALLFFFLSLGGAMAQEPADNESPISERLLALADRMVSTADLDEIQKRGFLRVLVVYSKSNFFIAEGQPRGFEYELLNGYEDFLNREGRKGRRRTEVLFIPVPFEELLPALAEGKGDIAAAGLTITPDRLQSVDFTEPYLSNVDEIVVTSRRVAGIRSLEDLSGRSAYVLPSTSFAQHIREMNDRLAKAGKPGLEIIPADRQLDTEAILELVDAGVVGLTVADRHVAQLWSTVWTNMVLRDDLRISTGGGIAWAVRKGNPMLLRNLNDYVRTIKKGTLLGNVLFKRYYEGTRWLRNPTGADEMGKLESYAGHFRRFGESFGFDWLALAAQGYQESGLDQAYRSPRGAIGVMQVLPSTAADKAVAVRNIHLAENNILAGAKYLNHLRETYFNDPALTPEARWNFALAAYNAGPARISELRRKAAKKGLDPNRWFFHVEYLALADIGSEPVRYVSNINRYYLAYRMSYDLVRRRNEQLEKEGGGRTGRAP